jgi:hypothetical protein
MQSNNNMPTYLKHSAMLYIEHECYWLKNVFPQIIRFSKLLKVKVKVKFTPQQAMKAQRGSRGIVLLFLQPRRSMVGISLLLCLYVIMINAFYIRTKVSTKQVTLLYCSFITNDSYLVAFLNFVEQK